MRIKKNKKNEYILAENVWVRNLCLNLEPFDINHLGKDELKLFLNNETENKKVSSLQIEDIDQVNMENVIICSDGFGWLERQKILGSIPNSLVKTICVNGSLKKWLMVGEKAEIKRTITFYLVNNPYKECIGYLPKQHRYYPNLIASTKTYPGFFKEYKNEPYFYQSPKNELYSGVRGDYIKIDDYRNPICASISLAWKRGVKKLALFCCDDSFEDERPGSIKMENGLYQYPQQIMSQKIIDKQLYWLSQAGVQIADCSSGIKYENAEYINIENLVSFFEKA